MDERPNVLFLMDDEHRADVLGFAGNDVVRTPNLDRLTEDGVVFENAYTPAPRCVPARQCMMSGQLPRTCGCHHYGEHLPPESMTWARRLAQYGYDTVAAGKLHHSGPDKAQGWTKMIGKSGGCTVERVDDAPELPTSPPGTGKWTDRKEIRRAGVGAAADGWRDDTDDYRVQGACSYLRSKYLDPFYDRVRPEAPLALKVSLSQPHYPYLTTEEKFEYYLNRVDPFVDETDRAFDNHTFLGKRRVTVGEDGFSIGRKGDVSAREIRRATAAYYGMIETVDEHFGRVLDTLERAGQDLDDWLVVYTSDHGEMLGEHGVWEKGHFFEASARVPLVVRWPDRFESGRISENVSLCDLFATLCDVLEIPLPADHRLDSRSLRPLLEGRTAAWRERHGNEAISAYGDDLMIKRDDLKYIAVAEDTDVLFDLSRDPSENENLIESAEYADARERFERRRDELGYGPAPAGTYDSAGYDPAVTL